MENSSLGGRTFMMIDLFSYFDGWKQVEIRLSVAGYFPGFVTAFRNPSVGVVIIYADGVAWVHYGTNGEQSGERNVGVSSLHDFLKKHWTAKVDPELQAVRWVLSEEDKLRLHGMGVLGD